MIHTIVISSLIVTGLIIIAFAIPLMKKLVKPNGFYGIRIKQTAKSENAWYEINAYGGKTFLYAGIATIVTAPICVLSSPKSGPITFTILATLPVLIFLSVAIYAIVAFAKKHNAP